MHSPLQGNGLIANCEDIFSKTIDLVLCKLYRLNELNSYLQEKIALSDV